MATEKTFYLETFGCQMNAHDSEKVIGTLQQQGYRQVVSEEEAGLILYNTCSIRDKAEQKVFNRLNDYKKLHKAGKRFGVLGCVAQQEGEKIFERAPYVSLVSGSASYRKLPEMLARLEAGENRITGLDDRQTDETFETEFTARQNPYRGYITIIEGCDKFCAYCVVPYTRGKERSRTSTSVLEEARRIADLGYTEIQLLGQNVNSYRDPEGKRSFAELLVAVSEGPGHSPCPLHHQPSARLYPRHRRGHRRRPSALRPCAPARAVWFGPGPPADGQGIHPGVVPGAHLLDQSRHAGPSRSPPTSSSAFPAKLRRISSRPWTCWPKCEYDCVFGFKYSARPNTPALAMIDSIPETEKAQRLQVLLDRQREIQRVNYSKHLGQIMEVMVEGQNPARGQVSGTQQPEQAGEFHLAASHCARARKLCAGQNHGHASKQSGWRSRLT